MGLLFAFILAFFLWGFLGIWIENYSEVRPYSSGEKFIGCGKSFGGVQSWRVSGVDCFKKWQSSACQGGA